MKIGSHVSVSAPDYFKGALEEALSYEANAFMIYTGAPQNTKRTAISKMKAAEMREMMEAKGIPLTNVIAHAPYIINLANTTNPATFELAVEFLAKEVERVKAIGSSVLVLHPGSHVGAGEEAGIAQIVKGLNEVRQMVDFGNVKIALETMAGKGSEIGATMQQIKMILEQVEDASCLGVCMDTCHLHDSGVDLTQFDAHLDAFDSEIGLDRLLCIHINDSKNERGARKDRHANIGFGKIGFDTLNQIVHHPRLADVVKILETPYVEKCPPYRHEIKMLKAGTFDARLLEKIIEDGKQ